MDFAGHPLQMLLWMVVVVIVGLGFNVPVLIHARLVSIDFPGPWGGGGNGIVSFPVLLLWLAAGALALGGVWVFEAACRWFCRSLVFSDGSTAEFGGHAGQILIWWLVWVVAGRRWHAEFPSSAVVEIAIYAGALIANWQMLRWFVRNVELSNGKRFRFEGAVGELFGWQTLLGLSVLTVIGWAWVLAALYRWVARNTRADGAALRFDGENVAVLWRSLATILFSIPVVTIPWAWTWYTRWLVRSTTIEGQLGDV